MNQVYLCYPYVFNWLALRPSVFWHRCNHNILNKKIRDWTSRKYDSYEVLVMGHNITGSEKIYAVDINFSLKGCLPGSQAIFGQYFFRILISSTKYKYVEKHTSEVLQVFHEPFKQPIFFFGWNQWYFMYLSSVDGGIKVHHRASRNCAMTFFACELSTSHKR